MNSFDDFVHLKSSADDYTPFQQAVSLQELQEIFKIIEMFQQLSYLIQQQPNPQAYENLLFEGFSPQDWRYDFYNLSVGYRIPLMKKTPEIQPPEYYLNKYRKMLVVYEKKYSQENSILEELKQTLYVIFLLSFNSK